MSLGVEEVYALLPAIFRTRDAAAGEPLKSLIGVICEQVAVLQNDLDGLYDDAFIETCSPWVIPYIGDLVGWQAITPASRSEVADTIGYRRRKGTLVALEQIGRDVTGRPTHVVEYFRRLITAESMHHLRPHHASTLNLRHGTALENISAAAMPFDDSNRTIDVRRIAPRARMSDSRAASADAPDNAPLDVLLHGAGRYNIPEAGAFLWRWQACPVRNQPAFRIDGRRFMFSPLGNDMPLFNEPSGITPFAALSTRLNVPQPISRREFFDAPATFYGSLDDAGSVRIIRDGVPVPRCEICVCDLASDALDRWPTPAAGHVALDPVLGRIAFSSADVPPADVRLDYCYGFPAHVGGGSYDRTPNLAMPEDGFDWTIVVGDETPSGVPTADSLDDAVALWNTLPPAVRTGRIVLLDMYTAHIDLSGAQAVKIGAGRQLWIVAGESHVDANRAFVPGFTGSRATLFGDIDAMGGASDATTAGELCLSGVQLAGGVSVSSGALTLRILDSTLVPGRGIARDNEPLRPGEPSIVVSSPGATVCLVNAISGPLLVTPAASIVRICSSIVDATSPHGVAFAGLDGLGEGATLHVEDSTVIGKVHTYMMELASNSIFLARARLSGSWRAALWCTRRQAGCVRFCYLPALALLPRHYECVQGEPQQEGTLMPHFVSLRFGRPSYGLLSGACPIAIWQGADDEGQLGVYHSLDETQAVTNLFTRLGEYLPFALEAGIFLIPARGERRRPRAGFAYYGYPSGAAPALAASGAPDACTAIDERDVDDDLTQGYVGIGAHLI
ncbi:hypothetical protein [Paraburkholderia fynbosensis]|uniref:Uncharacterized protein n=1 Tax=Paraburkholderia fynbosensis TaxID=1200993 RepID=A0A6J5GIE7_9BURK|nr:hypothetical protein [Paraburkholderia fynbosensis]CAB3801272.1 hypothetical protein LMG27177_05013 [Paraburkholderia fynbosensis]